MLQDISKMIKSFKIVASTPSMALMKINKIYHQTRVGQFHPSGVDIFEEDWDNLIILDACRADSLERLINIDGTFESRSARGTSTPHFLRSNFAGRSLHDTVYVTANGWIVKLLDELDVELHKLEFLEDGEYQDNATGATRPEAVTHEAKQYAEQYPNKRLIAHYVQPHKPYLGEFGRETFESAQRNLQQIMTSGSISEDELQQAYNENLELVLDHVEELVDSLRGKTVITADHGELLGERISPIPIQGYGHPDHIYHQALTEIPWFTCEYETRREIAAERPERMDDVDEEQLTEQLKDLGYAV